MTPKQQMLSETRLSKKHNTRRRDLALSLQNEETVCLKVFVPLKLTHSTRKHERVSLTSSPQTLTRTFGGRHYNFLRPLKTWTKPEMRRHIYTKNLLKSQKIQISLWSLGFTATAVIAGSYFSSNQFSRIDQQQETIPTLKPEMLDLSSAKPSHTKKETAPVEHASLEKNNPPAATTNLVEKISDNSSDNEDFEARDRKREQERYELTRNRIEDKPLKPPVKIEDTLGKSELEKPKKLEQEKRDVASTDLEKTPNKVEFNSAKDENGAVDDSGPYSKFKTRTRWELSDDEARLPQQQILNSEDRARQNAQTHLNHASAELTAEEDAFDKLEDANLASKLARRDVRKAEMRVEAAQHDKPVNKQKIDLLNESLKNTQKVQLDATIRSDIAQTKYDQIKGTELGKEIICTPPAQASFEWPAVEMLHFFLENPFFSLLIRYDVPAVITYVVGVFFRIRQTYINLRLPSRCPVAEKLFCWQYRLKFYTAALPQKLIAAIKYFFTRKSR